MLGVHNPPIEISPCLQRLAQRRWDIAHPTPEARIQGIFSRARDAIAHFFLYRLYQDYRDFYRSLAPLVPIVPIVGGEEAPSEEEVIPEELPPITRTIAEEKAWLHEQRQIDPVKFPPYLDEVLDEGHLYLYQHLLQINAIRYNERHLMPTDQIPLSSASHIILEVKKFIIEKIECAIPEDHGPILFLIGPPHSGKSTTFCFLRGDPMAERKGHFESTSDAQQLIEHSYDTSGPFPPAIAVVRGWTLIDYPSLDTYYDPQVLISLGAEFALKALLNKYPAQILVIQSILGESSTLRENAGELKTRLDRLVENKSSCLLGFTKYSACGDYHTLKRLEQQQRSELQLPSQDENSLKGQIDGLDMAIPILETSEPTASLIKEKTALQEQLETLQKARQEKQSAPLPDTKEMEECRARLRTTEQFLLTRMGLQDPLRFDRLDDPQLVEECFAVLSQEREPARVRPQPPIASDSAYLSYKHNNLLNTLFHSQLSRLVELQSEYPHPADLGELEELIASSSLISVICSQSHPEIGEFLHLPENDPRIARKYDQELIQKSLNGCIKLAYEGLHMNIIHNILNHPQSQVSPELLDRLRDASEALRDDLLRIVEVYPEDSPDQAATVWRSDQRVRHFHTWGEPPKLPRWAPALLGLSSEVRYGIPTLANWYRLHRRVEDVDNACVENLIKEIDFTREALLKLKRVHEMVHPAGLSL